MGCLSVFLRSSRIFFALTISIVFSGFLRAESILDIYEQALQSDPEYLGALEQHGASSEVFIQARSLLLPSMNLVASYTETQQDINSADNQVFASGKTDYPTQDYAVNINQSIYSFSHWAGFDKAKAEVQLLDAELQAIRQDLIERVADRYFAALAANENFEAIKAEKKAVAKQYELAKEKGTKLGRKSDLLDAEARFFQVESREIELRNRLQVTLQQLRELTGVVPATLTLMGDAIELSIPEPNDPKQILQAALASNPEIDASSHAVEVAVQQLRQEEGQRYPTLNLALRFNSSETEGTLFGGGSDVDTADIAVSLNIPLYSGGAVSSKIRESSRLLARAQQQLEMQTRRVQTDTFSAYDGILAAIAKVNALARSVASHEQLVAARQEESRAGLLPTIALLDAERDLFFARVEYASARYDYILNTLRLKRVVGSLNDADLAFIDSLLTGDDADLAALTYYKSASKARFIDNIK